MNEPRYWVAREDALADFARRGLDPDWAFAFRDTTNVISNFRTAVAAIVGGWAFGYKAPNVAIDLKDTRAAAETALDLLGVFNSFAFDYVVRQKFFGANFIKSILDQIAVPCRDDVARWSAFIRPRVLELTYTAWALQPFARACGYSGPPFAWDEERRFVLRCELDAAIFRIYVMTPGDIEFVLDSFSILRNRELEWFGEYRTKAAILKVWDALTHADRAGRPYRTPVDLPSGTMLDPDATDEE